MFRAQIIQITDWSYIDLLIYQQILMVITHLEMFDIKVTCPLRLILGDGFLNLTWPYHAKVEMVPPSSLPIYK